MPVFCNTVSLSWSVYCTNCEGIKPNARDETTLVYRTIPNVFIGNTMGVMASRSKEEVAADSDACGNPSIHHAAAELVNSRLISAYPLPALALFLGLLSIYYIIANTNGTFV